MGLDETGSRVVQQIVDDKEQGPPKEWGPYRWYSHCCKEQLKMGSLGENAEMTDVVSNQANGYSWLSLIINYLHHILRDI